MWSIRRLRTKLITAFLLVMLIPVLEIGTYGYWFTRREFSQQALARSEQEVYLQAGHIVASLTQTQGDALLLGALPDLTILRQMHSEAAPADQIERWRSDVIQDFMVLLSVRPMYYSLSYLDAQGTELVRVVSDGQRVFPIRPEELATHSDQNYFIKAVDPTGAGVFVSPVTIVTPADDPPLAQINAEMPLVHFAMRPLVGDGVVLIDIHAGWLLRTLPQNRTADSWALIDHSGGYLVYPSHLDEFTTAPDGRAYITDTLHPLLDGDAGSFATGAETYVYTTIFPVADARDEFWVLYRSTPTHLLYANLGDFLAKSAFFLAGAVILGLGLALFLGHSIVAPVSELERMAVAFGHGGAAPALPTALPRDEIGRLTISFHTMAHELEGKRREAKHLIERLITAQEEERRLVAYDLHDGLIQQMVGARFHLTKCRETCGGHTEAASAGLRRGCDALSDAIAEGRRIIEGLRPAALDDLGLAEALIELAEDTARVGGWRLELAVRQLPFEPDTTVSVTLYRIAQEALNNIRNHASAHTVRFSLHNGDGIRLIIADDGVGFAPNMIQTSRTGLGITTMRERAELLGGACQITSTPGSGTTVEVWIPAQPVPSALMEAVV